MQEKIITIYCLCADFLIAYGHKDDPQAQISTAEVMTCALVASWFFAGNQEAARLFLKEHGYIKNMLSKSRFNRRLHALPDTLWQALFYLLAQIHQQTQKEPDYIVDSCPIPVCENMRIQRCKLYQQAGYRGYCASKHRYFYGLKLHLVVAASGKPVDLVLTPAAVTDTPGLRCLFLDLPDGSDLYADKGYCDYPAEDTFTAMGALTLIASRKSNSKRPHPGYVEYLCQVIRKRVETTFSQITQHFARCIHAVTPRGFELKVFLGVLAYSILG